MTPEARKADPFYRVFEVYESHFLNLRITWTLFHTFHQIPENVVIINEAAPTTFHEIGQSLVEHLLVQLGRLTDRPVEGKPELLSLSKIIEEAERCLNDPQRTIPEPYLFIELHPGKPVPTREEHNREFSEGLEQTLSEMRPILAALHAHRNKRIAHLDFAHAVGAATAPLPSLTFGEIERVLALLEKLLNAISAHLWQSSTVFQYPYLRDPSELIEVLKLGTEARKKNCRSSAE